MSKTNKYSWVVLTIVCLVVIAPNFAQYQLTVFAPELMESLELTSSQFSSIFSAPLIAAVIFGIIAGVFVDRFGIKSVIGAALFVTAAGISLRLAANDYITMFLCMVLSGVALAFLQANAAKIFASYFEPEKVGTIAGIYLAVCSLSMALGTITAPWFPNRNAAFSAVAGMSVVSVLIWFLFMKNPAPQETDVESETLSAKKPSVLQCLKVVVKSRSLWLVAIAEFINMGVFTAFSAFLPNALIERGISSTTAGTLASFATIGSFAGALAAPVITAKTGKTKLWVAVYMVLEAAGVTFAWCMPTNTLIAILTFFVGFGCGAIIPLLMTLPFTLPEIGETYAGTAGGFYSTIDLLGGVVLPAYIIAPVAGSNMRLLFLLTGGMMIIAVLISFFIPEPSTYQKF